MPMPSFNLARRNLIFQTKPPIPYLSQKRKKRKRRRFFFEKPQGKNLFLSLYCSTGVSDMEMMENKNELTFFMILCCCCYPYYYLFFFTTFSFLTTFLFLGGEEEEEAEQSRGVCSLHHIVLPHRPLLPIHRP